MRRLLLTLPLLLLTLLPTIGIGVQAQELNATVEINTQKIEGTNTSVFETLKKTLTEFLNEHRWTAQEYEIGERIKCSFSIIVNKYTEGNGRFECEAYIQALRPVYGASYTTTLWSLRDKKFNFDYREFDQLNFNEQQIDNTLTALLAYYAYLIIGLDMDAMAPLGGTELLQKAADITTNAQSLDAPGWKAYEDFGNRFGIINDYMAEPFKPFRQLQYDYHRRGLDQFTTDAEKARQAVLESLLTLKTVQAAKMTSVLPQIFAEYKREEIINIFKGQGTSAQKQPLYDVLVRVNASQANRWKEILK